jgi:hypothetical protein
VNWSALLVAEVWPDTVTVTSTVPVPAGLVAVQLLVEAQVTAVPAFDPKATVAPEVANCDPAIVTWVPPAAGPEVGVMLVTVGAVLDAAETVSCDADVPVEVAKVESPEYVPVTLAVPTGAWVELQLPVPELRVAVHSVTLPSLKITEPVGVPVLAVTVAENEIEEPSVPVAGENVTAVVVGVLPTELVANSNAEEKAYWPDVVKALL